mgnify:CR=1 FL=1
MREEFSNRRLEKVQALLAQLDNCNHWLHFWDITSMKAIKLAPVVREIGCCNVMEGI